MLSIEKYSEPFRAWVSSQYMDLSLWVWVSHAQTIEASSLKSRCKKNCFDNPNKQFSPFLSPSLSLTRSLAFNSWATHRDVMPGIVVVRLITCKSSLPTCYISRIFSLETWLPVYPSASHLWTLLTRTTYLEITLCAY